MKNVVTLALLLLLSSASFSQAPHARVNDLSWLAGCWGSTKNGREINEQYSRPTL